MVLVVKDKQKFPTVAAVLAAAKAESGFADLNLSAWVGLLAPAKTPQPVIDQLNRAVHKVLQGEVVAKLGESGMEVAPSTPAQLQQTIRRHIQFTTNGSKQPG